MSLTLAKIASNTATVEVQWGEDTIHVTYYPARVTEKTIQELQGMGAMKDNASNPDAVVAGYTTLNSVLVQLVKSWDVYEDAEETVMFPLTQERLAELPMMLRVQILKDIMGDIRPEAMAS